MLLVHDVHDGKVVIDSAVFVRHLQHFAVDPRLVVAPVQSWAFGRCAVAAHPVVGSDRVRGRPGAAAIEARPFTYRDEVVGPGDRQKLRLVLAKVGFPEEGVAFDDAPFPRWLAATDIKMQMRPAAAATLFAEDAYRRTHLDSRA